MEGIAVKNFGFEYGNRIIPVWGVPFAGWRNQPRHMVMQHFIIRMWCMMEGFRHKKWKLLRKKTVCCAALYGDGAFYFHRGRAY